MDFVNPSSDRRSKPGIGQWLLSSLSGGAGFMIGIYLFNPRDVSNLEGAKPQIWENLYLEDLRESLYLEDFSGNRSVLFPSALDTITEEDSSRVIQNLWCETFSLLHSTRNREPRHSDNSWSLFLPTSIVENRLLGQTMISGWGALPLLTRR